jgi:hypothetical protein
MARVALVLAGLTCALAGCGGSNRALSLPCNPQPQGAICVKVFHDHLSVEDVIAYLSASESPLAGKTWWLVLTAGGRTYPGLTRHGTPPIQVFCKVNGQTVTTGDGCHDTLADVHASIGDFPGFNPPVSLKSGGDVCVFEQIQTSGTWHTAAPPPRACSTVS